MSSPKLNMSDIRRHPATISDPLDLQPDMDVVLCYLLPPVARSMRYGQALIGLTTRPKEATAKLLDTFRQAYNHTPTWGIAVKDVATVHWVNTTDDFYGNPYAYLRITQSDRNIPPSESLNNLAANMAGVKAVIQELPVVRTLDIDGNIVNKIDRIVGFENLGLAPEPCGLNQFVVDLSKLE